MRFGDRILQRWRIAKAKPYIKPASRVCDVGCADGALFAELSDRVGEGIGLDPDIEQESTVGPGRLIPGLFPDDLPDDRPFDAITMLAVLEHIPPQQQPKLATDCAKYLNPGGRLIITVPSATVDRILDVLKFLRIVDGMSPEEHYGFKPGDTPEIFGAAGLKLLRAGRFQLGMNNLFVFEK